MPVVYIVAMDRILAGELQQMVRRLVDLCPFKFKAIDGLESPSSAYEPGRSQYQVTKILEKLLGVMPVDALKLVGITDLDLCTPVLTFVFGAAQLDGRVAVVSRRRLKPEFYGLPEDQELMTIRLTKEFLHELGHCFGLVHCEDPGCVMFFSNSVLIIDYKEERFCKSCTELLQKKWSEVVD